MMYRVNEWVGGWVGGWVEVCTWWGWVGGWVGGGMYLVGVGALAAGSGPFPWTTMVWGGIHPPEALVGGWEGGWVGG